MSSDPGESTPLRAVMLGCGDLGIRVGTALARAGHDLTGVRRTVSALPDSITGVAADLTSDELPDLPADLLLVSLTPDRRDEGGYRRTYVEGMRRGLEAVVRAGAPRRAVLVSSTSVYGDLEGDLDESTTPAPATGRAEALLEAERLFHDMTKGAVLRLSGLYGTSTRMIDGVRRGENKDPGRWTNRIHREDAATAIVHLLTMPAEPEALYVGTDDEPVTAGEVRDFIADELGIARPAPTGRVAPFGRRMRNDRLRAAGVELTYPSYREGYRASIC